MFFGSALACIGLLSIPTTNAFSDNQVRILVPKCRPQELFDPTCHLDDQPSHLNPATRQGNITRPTLLSHNHRPPIASLPTWVSPPFCLSEPTSGLDTVPYCVWTSRDFRSGRGISIIATQEAANTLASSRWFLNAHVQIPESVHTPGYKITPLPGRGLGLLADKTFEKGNLIMAEIPMLLSSLSFDKSNLSQTEQGRLYRNAVSRLSMISRKMLEGLHGHPDQSAAGKFAANAFNVFDFAGLFPSVARMNHDCRPNAAFYFDKHTFEQRLHAIKPIKEGEEITISYLSHYLPSSERHHRTHFQWGFTCTCSLCSSPSKLLKSDARLQRIRTLEVLLYQAHNQPNHYVDEEQNTDPETEKCGDETADSTDLAEELLLLYQEEGLDGVLARAYDNLVLAWRRKGNKGKQNMRNFARLGIEASALWPGPGSVEMKRFLNALEG